MRRAYADTPVTSGQTHYRRAGSGAPLLLFHPSPLSSRFMAPLGEYLTEVADVIAPDTPGYGASTALRDSGETLSPYVAWLLELIDQLALEQVTLYGSATGAQLAIEFARAHPERLRGVILDNAAHFENTEREEILRHYLPELTVQESGAHLEKVWAICSGLFQWFPWYAQDDDHRVGSPAPLEQVQATVLEYLRAGDDYGRAYRAAFANEDARRVLDISSPVRVIRWPGSILWRHSRAYDEIEWPAHIQMVPCGPDPSERLAAIRSSVLALAGA